MARLLLIVLCEQIGAQPSNALIIGLVMTQFMVYSPIGSDQEQSGHGA
jgi:hypothetical protein